MARRRSRSAAAAKKKSNNKASSRSGGMVPIDQVLATNAVLRASLESLGATPPLYVIGKNLEKSDVDPNQARLLFSCKKGALELSACFTEQETLLVGNKEVGLLVTAFDRNGRSYDLTCKYLASNNGYRFIAGWKAFVEANGLMLQDDESSLDVELWAFRSRALPNRLVVDVENKTGKKEKVFEETGHPDGALGLVLLYYKKHAGGDDREKPMTRQKDRKQRETIKRDEMIAKYGVEMTNAAIGMVMLRRVNRARDRSQGYIVTT